MSPEHRVRLTWLRVVLTPCVCDPSAATSSPLRRLVPYLAPWQFSGPDRACLLRPQLPCCLGRPLSWPLEAPARSPGYEPAPVRPCSPVAGGTGKASPSASVLCHPWKGLLYSSACLPGPQPLSPGDSTSSDTPALPGPYWPGLRPGSPSFTSPAPRVSQDCQSDQWVTAMTPGSCKLVALGPNLACEWVAE